MLRFNGKRLISTEVQRTEALQHSSKMDRGSSVFRYSGQRLSSIEVKWIEANQCSGSG